MNVSIGMAVNEDALDANMAHTDFVLLPEMFNCDYSADGLTVLSPTNAVLEYLIGYSRRESQIYLIAGTLPLTHGSSGKPRNESLTLHKGEIVHRVSKIHLFKPINDQELFERGEYRGGFTATVRDTKIRCGVIVCYDLRFPELTRKLAMEGLDILFVPAYWNIERDLAWKTLLRARALENQIFVVGCNGDGKSYSFAPDGRCCYESDGIIESCKFDIELSEIAEARKFLNTLDDTCLM